MDRYAETLGRYGVRERARMYSQGGQNSSAAAWNGDHDNVLELYPRKKRKAPPKQESGAERKRSDSPYRVRNMVRNTAAAEASSARVRTTPAGNVHARRKPPQGTPRTVPRSGPDMRRNHDGIFSGEETSRANLEAYRLARARKTQTRIRRIMSVMLLMILFSVCALSVTYKLIYVIDGVTVTGSQKYSDAQILEASGVQIGDNLYSFKASEAEARVTLRYPYVRQLQVQRTAPSSVLFQITEDTAVYYAEIYGDVYELSDSLRVLNRTDAASARDCGLIRLRLPAVDSAVAGRVLSFSEEKYSMQIRKVLSQLKLTTLMSRITSVDCRNPNYLQIICDEQFRLDFGSLDDIEVKLKIAQAVLEDDLFNTGVKASVDLTSTGATSVVLDDQLEMDA